VNSSPARIFVIGLVVLFILIGIAAVIGAIMNPHYMINYTGGWVGIASGIVGTLIGLFFLFIFIWIIVWLVRSLAWVSRVYRYSSRNRWTWWDHYDALEILREKYARGEITKEQYVKMREDLRNEN